MGNEIQKQEEYVTPEYLLSHGFYQYKSEEEGGLWEIPWEREESSYHFREIKSDRRICVVTFHPRLDHEGYHYSVYFQDDAGCGFIQIPFYWWDLPIEYFEAVYYGIRGEKPKFTGFTDIEIIEPKQIGNGD